MKKLFFILLSIVLLSCGGGYKSGDTVTIKERCFSTTTAELQEPLSKYSVRKDEESIKGMIFRGEVIIIPANTVATVKNYKLGLYQVDIDGDQVWITSNSLK